MKQNQELAASWFHTLRDSFIDKLEAMELEYANIKKLQEAKFTRKNWSRPGGGGGEMSVMKGGIFEKVGVNVSTVHGKFDEEFRGRIPGADQDGNFFATGISFVAHPSSPLIPAAHFNTRFIETTKSWFGGGGDLTPTFPQEDETSFFHTGLKSSCDRYERDSYEKYKKHCDEYFYLKHRSEARGVGGIFFDYLNTDSFEKDFDFIKDLGETFLATYSAIVRQKLYSSWTDDQKEQQLIKRGRYVEFNLLYDRGTHFGLMTNGNIDAIFMSLPPSVKWL